MLNENSEKENLNSVDTNEKIQTVDEIQEVEEVVENKEEIKLKTSPFMKSLIDNLTNAVIALGISTVLTLVIDLILRLCGYFISNKITFTFVMFFIIIVFLEPIIDTIKSKKANDKEN